MMFVLSFMVAVVVVVTIDLRPSMQCDYVLLRIPHFHLLRARLFSFIYNKLIMNLWKIGYFCDFAFDVFLQTTMKSRFVCSRRPQIFTGTSLILSWTFEGFVRLGVHRKVIRISFFLFVFGWAVGFYGSFRRRTNWANRKNHICNAKEI